jgi:hypothetical protein
VHLAAIGYQRAVLSGVGEERDGCFRIRQDQVLDAIELKRGQFRPVRQTLHGGQAGAAFEAGGQHLGEQLCPGGRGDPRGRDEATLAQGITTEENPCPAAAPDCLRNGFDRLSGNRS